MPSTKILEMKKEVVNEIKDRLNKSKSVVLFEQIRVIDKNRILRYIGKLNSKDLKNIDNKIAISLGIEKL